MAEVRGETVDGAKADAEPAMAARVASFIMVGDREVVKLVICCIMRSTQSSFVESIGWRGPVAHRRPLSQCACFSLSESDDFWREDPFVEDEEASHRCDVT